LFERQKSGSVLCPSCGQLVGVNDEQCLHCGRKNPGMWGYGAFVRALGRDFGFFKLVIFGCAGLYIASLALDPKGMQSGGLRFFAPSWRALFLLGGSGYQAVFELGRWWTVLSAGWLHGDLLHIGFNMYWVRILAPATAEFYGVGRTVIIYTVACVAGFVFSSVANAFVPLIPVLGGILGALGLGGAYRTIGASGAIFGLLGAIVYYGRRTGHQSVYRQSIGYVVIFAIFAIVVPYVDNQAHLGGFVGGYFAGKILDPQRPERGDHLFLAVVCLALSALSVAVSFWTGLKFFPAS